MRETPRTIPHLLRAQADRIPDAPAILAPGRSPLGYGALWHNVDRIARALRATGLRRRDRVAVVLPNGPEMAVAVLATASAATCTPLNPAHSAREFSAYMAQVRARALIVQTGAPSPARAIARSGGLPIIELSPADDEAVGLFAVDVPATSGGAGGGRGAAGARRAAFAEPGDVALALHTAGTTSAPKIVPLTHANLCASAENIRRALALVGGDRCLNVMPLFHVHGLVGALLASLAAGASVACAPGFSAPDFFPWLAACGATWYTAVPTIHQAILAEASAHPEARPGRRLRFVRSTSASLPAPVLADLERLFDAPVIEAYGTTEASMITCNPLPPGIRKPGSVGPVAGPEVAILDAAGRERHDGQPGEIAVRGPTVMRGYDGDPAANEAAFIGGWFRTGDQGHFDADGYLFITGRIEETIKRGGESIAPAEVDAVILEHPAVARAVTFAMPHPRLGEDVAAAVVLRPGATASPDEIRRFTAARLAPFKVPQQVLPVAELPLGPTGKPLRAGLAEVFRLRDPHGWMPQTAQAPPTPIEEILTGLAARVLALEHVGRDENFFALGGDSLLAIQLLSRVKDVLRVAVPVERFFETPTVAGMARTLAATGSASSGLPPPPLRPVPRDGPLPLSFAQQRLWLLAEMGQSGHAYHLIEVVHLRGPLRAEALAASLTAIAARHEVLRTRVVSVEGHPYQIIDGPGAVPLPFVDLREVPAAERDARVEVLALEEVRRPFDLARGPLLRATLLRLDEDEHVLLLAMHHIASDGWSYAVFWSELTALYQAAIDGKPSPLGALAVQYADHAHWEREWLDADALAASRAYWKGQLAGISSCPLPTDRPRPAARSFRGAREPIAFSPPITEALRALGRPLGATLFMTLLAAFQTLLHRYSGHDDIAVGTLLAHRTRSEIEPLIGFFVNTLVLRTDLSGNPRFQDLLERVRDTAVGAYSHQDLPFEKLVEELKPPRDPGRNPLFDVLFIFQNTPRPALALAGLTLRSREIDPGTAKFDLTLELAETAEGLRGWFEYSTDLFEPATVARMAGHLRVLLEGIAADPTRRLSELPLLTPAEASALLVEWNATAADYPADASIYEVFAAQAARTPDAVALIDGSQCLTYREIDRAATVLAHDLTRCGVGRGVVVGLCLPRSLGLVVGLLGILRAGGVYLPLDPSYPRERLGFMLADARAPVVLTRQEWTGLFPASDTRFVCLDAEGAPLDSTGERPEGAREGREVAGARPAGPAAVGPPAPLSGEDLAYVIYTSGSTGEPKGVAAPHRQVLNRLAWMWRAHPFAPGEVACLKTPLGFVDSIWECLGGLLQGIPTIIVPDDVLHDPVAFTAALAAGGVTRLWVVPSLLRALLERFPDLEARLPRLAFWVSSGEPIPLDLYRQFQAAMPRAALYNLYGISEVWDVTWYGPHPPDDPLPRVPIGRPISNVRVYLLDRYGQPVPAGVPGEIHVGGAGLSHGYLHRPELTAERFVPDPFSAAPGARLYRTGDLARHLPGGDLDFLGRLDDQIKLRGHRIEPREIELALERHPAVRQAAVVVRGDGLADRRLVAYVVTGPEPAASASALRRFLQPLLPGHMLPADYAILDRLPLTPSGKVDRRALPDPEGDRPGLDEGFVEPRTATEAILAAIWREILGVERVGVHDRFFDLGGHSLLAMRLLSRTGAATRIEVPLARFFEAPTVADVAHFIDTAAPTARAPAPIPGVPRHRPLPCSLAQEQLWHLHHLPRAAASLNLPYAIRISGPLDQAILEQSLATVVGRHETLRTTFRHVDGCLWQVVAPRLAVPITRVDLRGLPASAREAECRRQAGEAARQPFDLGRGPLVRLHLWRVGDGEHVLLASTHHIVSDGWSIGLFLRELAAAYEALGSGREAGLPALSIQYADVAAWQRHWTRDETLRGQLAYWKRRLRGPLRPPALPIDRPRPPGRAARTARELFDLPHPLVDALTALGRREGGTLFMTLVAGAAILLHTHTGEEDVRVATLLANRRRPETERVIGPLADLAILRVDLGGRPSWREVLRRVRATTLEAYAHQEFPFEDLVRALERERGLVRASLSRVLIVLQNAFHLPAPAAESALRIREMDQAGLAPEGTVTTFDLVLELRERPQGLAGACLYNAEVFEATTVRRLLGELRSTLEGMVVRPDRPLAAGRRGAGPGERATPDAAR